MHSIRAAVTSNAISAPVKVGLGIVQSALIARILTDGALASSALGDFAILASGVNLVLLVLSAGYPQVFSRVATDLLSSGNLQSLRSLLWFLLLARLGLWIVVGTAAAIAGTYFNFGLFGSATTTLTSPVGLLIVVWLGSADLGGLLSRLLSAALNQRALNRGVIASQVIGCGFLLIATQMPHAPLSLAITGMTLLYATRLCFFGLATRSCFRATVTPPWTLGEGGRIWRDSSKDAIPILLDKGASYLLSSSALILIGSLAFPREITGVLYLFFDFAAKAIALVSIPFGGLAIPILTRAQRQGHTAVTTTLESAAGLIAVTTFLVALGSITVGGVIFRLLYHVSWPDDAWMVPLVTFALCAEALTFELAAATRTAQREVGALVVQRTVIGAIGALVFLVATQTLDVSSSVAVLCFTKGATTLWLLSSIHPGQTRFAGLLLSLFILSYLTPALPMGEIGTMPTLSHILFCFLSGLGVAGIFLRNELRTTVQLLKGSGHESAGARGRSP